MPMRQYHLSYLRLTEKSPNPLARFAQITRYRNAEKLLKSYAPARSYVLDYGAGDGRLLERLRASRPDLNLYGFEPFMDPGQGYIHARHIQQFATLRFDIIACLEVLEHLRDHDIDCFVSFCHLNLNANGRIIISVPIMIGPIIVLKALNAKYTNRSTWSYSVRELFKSGIMLRNVDRDQDDELYLNHKGFDFRILRHRLISEFQIVNEFNGPLPWLWWGFNSQWFAILERKS